MANVNNAPGEQLIIQQGNGATPEVFTALCTINTTRSLDLTANATSALLADCVTPSNPAITARQVASVDMKFTGAGVADAVSAQALMSTFLAGATKNYKIVQNRTGAQGGFTFSLPMVITNMQLSGDRGNVAQTFTATFEAAGAITYAPNA